MLFGKQRGPSHYEMRETLGESWTEHDSLAAHSAENVEVFVISHSVCNRNTVRGIRVIP